MTKQEVEKTIQKILAKDPAFKDTHVTIETRSKKTFKDGVTLIKKSSKNE